MRESSVVIYLQNSMGFTASLICSDPPNIYSELLDILETTGEHLHRYSLSPKAASGILRRASRRGRSLPAALEAALISVASRQP